MSRVFNFPLFYCIISLLISCNPNSSIGDKTGVKNDTIKTDSNNPGDITKFTNIETILDTLILANHPGDPQLKKLLHDASKRDKLIIQFLKRPDGRLTLAIWPSITKNGGVDQSKMQVLYNWHKSMRPLIMDISKELIFLGDQQIADDPAHPGDTQIKYLKNNHIVNGANYELIFFMPKIKTNHIIYDLGFGKISDTSIGVIPFSPHPLPVNTDPSPPAPAR